MAHRLPKQAWLQGYFRIKSKTLIAKSEDFLDLSDFFQIFLEIVKIHPFPPRKRLYEKLKDAYSKQSIICLYERVHKWFI